MSGLSESAALLEVSDLSVTLFTNQSIVTAVDRANYVVRHGEVLAIVGESGSGKTIMNLSPLGLLPGGVSADLEGAVRFRGRDLLQCTENELQSFRGRNVGVIFQDPLSALNPVRTIGRQIAEVAEEHLGLTATAAERRATELLSLVGIPDAVTRMGQYPHELSGGMLQRVGIAISISGEPELLIADEPTTALDVTVQAQIVRLLKDIQKRLQMAIVLITHDVGVVSGMADRVLVMYAGRVAEIGPIDDVLLRPEHPYTKGLLASLSSLDAPVGKLVTGLRGMPPDLSERIAGCPFQPRCDFAIDKCSSTRPLPEPVRNDDNSHLAACVLAQRDVASMARS